MKILANDGISKSGILHLKQSGFEVITEKVNQDELIKFINTNNIIAILVRSATKVRRDIIDNCKSLKLIGRGGVGMDNIDVAYAKEKGLYVINTPAASSQSVAELVFSHLFSGARFLHISNREMPLSGDTKFNDLKKSFSAGSELKGKTIGIIGFGRIGEAVAKIAIGLGMKILVFDKFIKNKLVTLQFFDNQKITFNINTSDFKTVLQNSNFITLHIPTQNDYIIGRKEFSIIKKGSFIINAARGGIIDEVALYENIEKKHISFAGLDVFKNEPNPSPKLLMTPNISFTPHIGAATLEAQDRVGKELAEQICDLFIKN